MRRNGKAIGLYSRCVRWFNRGATPASPSVGPVFEALEDRRLLSGNVTVTLVGGVLTITGDGAGNEISISDDGAGTITIDASTIDFTPATLNGLSDPLEFDSADVTDIEISLGGGHDYVDAEGLDLDGSFTFIGGSGNDTLFMSASAIGGDVGFSGGKGTDACVVGGGSLIGGNLDMHMGKGNDAGEINFTNDIVGTQVSGTVRFIGGAGQDNFFIPELENPDAMDEEIIYTPIGHMILNGNGGRDSFALERVDLAGDLHLSGGAKDTDITIFGSSFGGRFIVRTGDGDDTITLEEVSTDIEFDVRTKDGRDTLTLTDVSTFARTLIHMGNDADSLTIESGLIWGLLANGGKGKGDVFEEGDTELYFTEPRIINFEPVMVTPV